MDIFPALNPRFLCNGMAIDSATRTIICTSLGQSTSWFANSPHKKHAIQLRTKGLICEQVAADIAAFV